jgi:crotonobetainyl-CoA:carnitine CoA-transferase CaiB-like acyl-CoA transferase
MDDSLLGGLIALDLTDDKGFLCGKILADMGVEVIKIEQPGGDQSRNIPPFYHDIVDPERSLYWFSYNGNKQGITLNLETDKGKQLFIELTKKADFVIESFEPGFMTKLGLSYDELEKINPKIIMTSITPFGQTGPYCSYKASDIILEAMGELLIQTGYPDRPPVRTTIPQAFMHAGAEAAEGTMIAHYFRNISGFGQHVDVSAMESILWVAERVLPYWNADRTEIMRTAGSILAAGKRTNPGIFACKDEDSYILFMIQGGLMGSKTNKRLTEWMDGEGKAPQFMKEIDWDNWDWQKSTIDEINSYVEAVIPFFKLHTADELVMEATKRGIMLDKICNSKDTVNSVQLAARQFWIDIHHKELNETIKYPGAFAKFNLTPIKFKSCAPRIGEHNYDIYEKFLGLNKNQITNLKNEGVI